MTNLRNDKLKENLAVITKYFQTLKSVAPGMTHTNEEWDRINTQLDIESKESQIVLHKLNSELTMSKVYDKYMGLYEPPSEGFRPDKVIFLDIDGVICTEFKRFKEDGIDDHNHDFNRETAKYLDSIVDATGAYIVISSTWRKRDLEWIRGIFKRRGFKNYNKIIGETCRGYHFKTNEFQELRFYRGNEIDSWINRFLLRDSDGDYINNAKYHYVILDDDSDMLYWQKDNFIKIDGSIGLTEEQTYLAIDILMGHVQDK